MSARTPFIPSRPAPPATGNPSQAPSRPKSSSKTDGNHHPNHMSHFSGGDDRGLFKMPQRPRGPVQMDQFDKPLGTALAKPLNLMGLKKTGRPSTAGPGSSTNKVDEAPTRSQTPGYWATQNQQGPLVRPSTGRPSSPFMHREAGGATGVNFGFKHLSLPFSNPSEHSFNENSAHISGSETISNPQLGHDGVQQMDTARLPPDSFMSQRLRLSSTSLESIPEAEDSGYFSAQPPTKRTDYTPFVPSRSSGTPHIQEQPGLEHPSPKRALDANEDNFMNGDRGSGRKRLRTTSPSAEEEADFGAPFAFSHPSADSKFYPGPSGTFDRREHSQNTYAEAPSFFKQSLPASPPRPRGSELSQRTAHTIGDLPGLELTEADMQRYADLSERARIRWTEASLEEWHEGADEFTEKFGKLMNMVKEHMTEKMKLYASLHSKLADHRSKLGGRAELLKKTRDTLVRDSEKVLGGSNVGGISSANRGN
ncbi:hypothetical protein BV25DRAFT_1822739 [Artomyces pyxidatus]|uniref:Uncharacterized protein n=1 Tax=Artomyces pyxidatus TaxID=48021 RepID=A0ACB8T7V9_9AGAM|nr:hypothetical protein BV25DRAFT_1822739 [Artomyces pyxidatus]